ncbi:conserved hypothetical protein [Tenacibaculum sp. 190524A02b]
MHHNLLLKLKLKFKKITLFIAMIYPFVTFSQNLEKIGKSSLFKLSGGVGVNAVFYNGESNREPFTYFLSGNVNLNISDVYNIPFSFSYSNSKFQTNNPFSFNRLSLHPSYKWVTAHIGDVSMTFSPYTLSGHQFTGLGLDLTPKDKLKISVMYGELLKAREFDPENTGDANYKRIGYGLKASYKFDKFSVGGIFFRATDDLSSLKEKIPVESNIQPKDNTVISFDGEFSIIKDLKIRGEVAVSALTEDVRAGGIDSGFMSFLLKSNVSTQYYKAYNLNFLYQVGKGSIGLGYEFIDPNYKTLGGYFFNNDLENITINATQRIFKDKLGITVNAGLQRDDLDGSKASQLKRLVSSVNLNFDASKKMNMTLAYSNFQSFTNIKNQFDFINGVSQIEQDLDRSNVSQISQNANLNVNYILLETEDIRQNLNVGLTFQDATNKVENEEKDLDKSTLYNGNIAYTIGYPQLNLNISGALNASYNQLIDNNSVIFGPTLSASKSFFDKKLKVNSSLGYNQSRNNGKKQGDITNFRASGRYVYKKQHNFSLNGLMQLRNSVNTVKQDFTLTFGYTYNFGLFDSKNIKFKKRKRKNKKKKNKEQIKFVYKDSIYKGSIREVDTKIEILLNSSVFKDIPKERKEKFNKERKIIAEETNKRIYKIKAIQFLKELYDSEKSMKTYYSMLKQVLDDLWSDANRLDYNMELEYLKNRKEIIKHVLWNKPVSLRKDFSKKLQKEFEIMNKKYKKSEKKLLIHRWIVSTIKNYKVLDDIRKDDGFLRVFFIKRGNDIFEMIDNDVDKSKIKLYLLTNLIEFLAKESEKYIDESQYELKYIYKTN